LHFHICAVGSQTHGNSRDRAGEALKRFAIAGSINNDLRGEAYIAITAGRGYHRDLLFGDASRMARSLISESAPDCHDRLGAA
jgi:hypothetical protein